MVAHICATNDSGFRNVRKFFRSKIVHDRISLNAECAETQRFAEKDKIKTLIAYPKTVARSPWDVLRMGFGIGSEALRGRFSTTVLLTNLCGPLRLCGLCF